MSIQKVLIENANKIFPRFESEKVLIENANKIFPRFESEKEILLS